MGEQPEMAEPEAVAAVEKEGPSCPMSRQEIEEADIQEMAKDKFKSRLLQRSLARGGPEMVQLILNKAEPHIMDLVRDQYGNYLSQKILEVASEEQFDSLFNNLKEQLHDLSKDVHGTRAVQKVVEQAIDRGKASELLEVLNTDLIAQLALSVTGFHVVVRLLEVLPESEAGPVIEGLCSSPEKALALGKDQWGCCVLKKCLDCATPAVREKVSDAVTDSTLELVQDPFGNYVIQHLLHDGMNPAVTKVVDSLKGKMFDFALQKFSSNVLEKCLLNSTDKDRNKIINEILNPPNVLPSEAVRRLLFHQYGNYVFQQALEVAKDPQFSLLVEHAKQHVQDAARPSGGNSQAPSSPSSKPGGKLAPEHTRRLATKLAKHYPQLSEGLELDVGNEGGWGGGWNNGYCDPYSGYDAFGGPWMNSPVAYGGFPYGAWDPHMYGKGKGSGPSGGRHNAKDRGKGKREGQPREKPPPAGPEKEAAEPGGAGGTMRVPRIVGFWPNYSVTYDEVPMVPPMGGKAGLKGRGGKAKGRGKGKGPPPS